MKAFAGRNWPGGLAILLAATAVALYAVSVLLGPNVPVLGKLGQVLFDQFQLTTTASLVVGIAAVFRARRGDGGMATAIVGLGLGGTLTLMWVAWFAMLMLNPGAMGE